MSTFALIAACILSSALAAFTRREIVHAALWLVLAWLGLAAFYLWAGAEFLALAQALVYVGALSMVVLFAVLLTRAGSPDGEAVEAGLFRRRGRGRDGAAGWIGGVCIALLATGALAGAILRSPWPAAAEAPSVAVRVLGQNLAGPQAVSLLVAGLLLTVALIGAVLLASSEVGRGRRAAGGALARGPSAGGETEGGKR